MQLASLPSLLCLAVGLGRVAAAPAATSEAACPRTLCVDGITPCGVRFGGCYDSCKPELRPVAPFCVSATTVVSASVTSPASGSRFSVSTSPVTTISTRTLIPPTTRPLSTTTGCPDGRPGSGMTVCWDGINDCGQMYGGCFPDCKPWPTFSKPPCRTPTAKPTVTYAP